VNCTSLAAERLSTADGVHSCKALTRRVCLQGTVGNRFASAPDPLLAAGVRPHIFLCLLAYCVEWHMREAWRPLHFADNELAAHSRARDLAEQSGGAHRQKDTRESGGACRVWCGFAARIFAGSPVMYAA